MLSPTHPDRLHIAFDDHRSDSELAIYRASIVDALRSARRAHRTACGRSMIAMEALDVAAALC